MRWLPVIMVVAIGYVAIPAALDGDRLMLIFYVLIVFGSAWSLMFDPATRPKNIPRSLEAARQVVASSGRTGHPSLSARP
jgi:hypothetical protein